MKNIIAAILLFASIPVAAQTVSSACQLLWDYNPAEVQFVDNFNVYVDNLLVHQVPGTQQFANCSDLGLTAGEHAFHVTASNAAGESANSNVETAIYVESAPGAPTQFRISGTLQISGTLELVQ
jgi:hypothetical protein